MLWGAHREPLYYLIISMHASITHRASHDPKHVHDAPSLKTFTCTKCGYELNTFASTSELCPTCHLYTMKQKQILQSHRVAEIMNRTSNYTKPLEEKSTSPHEAWDDGVIQRNLHATVFPIGGSGTLQIHGHSSKTAWMEKVVEINGGWYRLADIGKALTPML